MFRIIKKTFQTIAKPQEHSLKLQAIRSAFWGFLGKGSAEFFRLIGNLILTRLLFPEAFGLMALANSTLMMINLFSDTGIKTAIIQNPEGGSSRFINTAWIISICRGIILCLIIVLLSWPLSIFYNEPSLQTVLLIISLNPLVGGFENPSLSLYIKKFRVDKLVIFELSLRLIGLSSTVFLVYLFRSVEALAIAVVLSALYRTFGSYLVSRPFPKFCWDSIAGKEIFHFGKFIFLNTMITWMAGNIDTILIGKLLGVGTLAFYNLGKSFAYLAFAICTQIMFQSYFPAISSVCKEPHRVIKIYKSTISVSLVMAIPLAMCLSIFAHDIINLLYDSRYETAYISMTWLSLFTIFRIIGGINGSTLIGIGKPFLETVSNLVGLIIAIVSLSIGVLSGGLKGAAIGMSISFFITAFIENIFILRTLKGGYSIILQPWVHAIAGISIILSISLFLKQWLVTANNNFILFIICITIMSVTVSIGIYRLLKDYNFSYFNKGSKLFTIHHS